MEIAVRGRLPSRSWKRKLGKEIGRSDCLKFEASQGSRVTTLPPPETKINKRWEGRQLSRDSRAALLSRKGRSVRYTQTSAPLPALCLDGLIFCYLFTGLCAL